MTDKKIRNFWYMTFFLDKETKKPAIICKQKNECRPPKSIEDFKNDGGDLIHDYEVAECNLKEAEKDMPEEDGEYKGKHLDDTESWERAVCDKYNLITSDEIEFKFSGGGFLSLAAADTIKMYWYQGSGDSQNLNQAGLYIFQVQSGGL